MPKTNGHKACQSAVGKQPLKKFTIAISGNFGEQRSIEQMKRWIQANGGTFAADISAEVTHLVCSKEHFKKSVATGMAYCSRMERVLIQLSFVSPKGTQDQDRQNRLLGLVGGYFDEGTPCAGIRIPDGSSSQVCYRDKREKEGREEGEYQERQ